MKTVLDVQTIFKGVNEKDYSDFLADLRDLAYDYHAELDEKVAEYYEVDSE